MGREKVERTGHHGEVHALNRSKNVNVSIIWLMLKQVPKKCPVTFDTPREKMEMSEETSQKKLRISKTIQERIISAENVLVHVHVLARSPHEHRNVQEL